MFIKGFSFCGLSTNQLKITLEVNQGDASKETKLPDPSLFAMTGHMMMRSSTHLHLPSQLLAFFAISTVSKPNRMSICQFAYFCGAFFCLSSPLSQMPSDGFLLISSGATRVSADGGRFCRPQQCNLMPVSVSHVMGQKCRIIIEICFRLWTFPLFAMVLSVIPVI